MAEGIRFESENAGPFVRAFLRDIYDLRPLYINGRWDVFFFGCPCKFDGDIGHLAFQLNVKIHRRHLLQKIFDAYGVYLEYDDLLNGSGHLGGLADHVHRLYRSSEARRQEEEKAKETQRVSRLQDKIADLSRLGILRVMSSGDVSAYWTDRLYRETPREGSLPRFNNPERTLPG